MAARRAGSSTAAPTGAFAGGCTTTRLLGELVDRETTEPCVPLRVSDEAVRCLPSAAADVASFEDASGTRPAFAVTTLACERPELVGT